jgi:hypothetical protein
LRAGAIVHVHLLHHGRAPCGMEGVPGDWPDGHKWVGLEGLADVTCSVCTKVGNNLNFIQQKGGVHDSGSTQE